MTILEKYPANYSTWLHPEFQDPLNVAKFEDDTVLGINGFHLNTDKQLDESRQGISFQYMVIDNPKSHDKEFLDMIVFPHAQEIFRLAMEEANADPEFKQMFNSEFFNDQADEAEKKKQPNTLIRESGLIL